MALLTCNNLSFAYEGRVVADCLNFSVHAGDYLCIVGENGSGKSTLVKGLLNLKKPCKGEILRGEGLLPNEIGYLPQQTETQKDFPASVFEVVLSGCLNQLGWKPFYTKKEKDIALENMARLDIEALKNKSYRALSGGQQQRVLLARALCATKKIILLDEPTAGLDPIVTGELHELIARINREFNITVIMVSHDLPTAVRYADHILHLQGQQLFFGTTEIYVKSAVGKQYIGGLRHA